MAYRIGINLGDIVVDGADIHGDGVNVAARIEKLTPAGGICVAQNVHEQVEGKVPCRFKGLGEHAVKNIAKPVRVFQVEAVAIETPNQPRLSDEDKASVAILPSANMGGDADQEFFSDGITEDIIAQLSRSHELLVTARNSSFVFKGHNVDVKDAAAKLGVHYVVEGSVRKAGKRVRITAQLIDAETTKHVWAERYDRDLADVFEVQDEVARTIATIVAGRAKAVGAERAHRRPTDSLSAHENYLRAREHMRGYENAPKAEPFLLRAIEPDPRFALAHALLSPVNVVRFFVEGDPRFLEVALGHARNAIELDRQEAWCHMAMGHPLVFLNRLDETDPYLDRPWRSIRTTRSFSCCMPCGSTTSAAMTNPSPKWKPCCVATHSLWTGTGTSTRYPSSSRSSTKARLAPSSGPSRSPLGRTLISPSVMSVSGGSTKRAIARRRIERRRRMARSGGSAQRTPARSRRCRALQGGPARRRRAGALNGDGNRKTHRGL